MISFISVVLPCYTVAALHSRRPERRRAQHESVHFKAPQKHPARLCLAFADRYRSAACVCARRGEDYSFRRLEPHESNIAMGRDLLRERSARRSPAARGTPRPFRKARPRIELIDFARHADPIGLSPYLSSQHISRRQIGQALYQPSDG